jgi:hypothetical protein
MGPNLHDVYEAIFDVEPDLAEEDAELFTDQEQDRVGLHSWASRESGRPGTYTPPLAPPPPLELYTPNRPAHTIYRSSSLPHSRPGEMGGSPQTPKPTLRPSLLEPLSMPAEAQSSAPLSPLARLFSTRQSEAGALGVGPSPFGIHKLDKVEEGVRRVQELLEDVRDLPVSRLKEEMRELQERQARIEGLLLMLTRGMRHEAGSAMAPSRHDTL